MAYPLLTVIRRKPPRFVMEAALVIVGLAAGLYFFYPGCMSGDPGFSWKEALRRPQPQFHDWHPPLVAYAWRLLNRLPVAFTPPYAGLFVAMNLLFWVGLVLAIRPWFERERLWIAFFVIAGFFPPSFGLLSQPIKDSLMCAALLAAYGGLLAAQREGSKTAFGFALFCLFLALGFRHNALFAVFPFALWAGFILGRNAPDCTWWKKTAVGCLIFFGLVSAVGSMNRALTAASSYPVQMVYTYDLVGISARTGRIYLPALYDDYNKPPVLINFWRAKGWHIDASPLSIENIRKLHSGNGNNIYFHGPGKGLRFLDREEEVRALRDAWLAALLEEPATYLKMRYDLYKGLIGLRYGRNWPYYCLGEPVQPHYEMQRALPWGYWYIKDTWLFKGVTYLGAILAMLGMIGRRRRAFPPHITVLGASAALYAASYFLIGAGPEFRYLYWLMPVCVIMAVNMAFITLTKAYPEPER